MTTDPTAGLHAWADARLAVQLLAVDPVAMGGMLVRAWPGSPRDALLGCLRGLLPAGSPWLRVPLHVTQDRVLGGLSLAATLARGQVVVEQGLLAQAHGGILVLPMAERLEPGVCSQVCSVMDQRMVRLQRDGINKEFESHVGVVALDEGLEEERVADALRDRLALHVNLTGVPPGAAQDPDLSPALDPSALASARLLFPRVECPPEHLEALCQAAQVLGVDSLRAPVMAVVAARAHAALQGRTCVEDEDATAGARLVLGPRATRVPQPAQEQEAKQPGESAHAAPPPSRAPDAPAQEDRDHKEGAHPDAPLQDLVLQAAKSGIPQGVLDALVLGQQPRSAPRSQGQSGALRQSLLGGRPAGVRARAPGGGQRLHVVETLRAAAPWQLMRRRERALGASPRLLGRVEIRKEDFRCTRFKQRSQTCVVFCVDASGSAALQRLAEAKGAVERVLLDCHVRRDHVALIAFRGAAAQPLLSPTRSLARARRCLADLAGGGTTPLAAGLDAGLALALDAQKRGQTPLLVLMTDGRANVARAGHTGLAAARSDATQAALAVRHAGVRALFLDTAPRPRPEARELAAAMGARYLPLPYLDAAGISVQVQSLARAP